MNVLKCLLLSLVICTVTSSNIRPQLATANDVELRNPINDGLYNLLDNFRHSLKCGFPEQDIPPLAPFVIKSAEVDERGLIYSVRGNIRDLMVSGLDGYEIDVATLNILTLRFSIGLTFPKVSLNGLYELDALLLRFLPIFGHGRLAMDVNDFAIRANGRMSILSGRLNLTSLDITVDMGSFHSDNTGVYDSRIVSTVFNVAFERIVENTFRNNKANIENALQDLLIPIANEFLNELTLQDLLGLINGGGRSEGPHIDVDTGELVCHAATTTLTSTESSTETDDNSQTDATTLPSTLQENSTVDEAEPESTTNSIDPDETNSSNFLFNKFQVMILTVASIVSLVSNIFLGL